MAKKNSFCKYKNVFHWNSFQQCLSLSFYRLIEVVQVSKKTPFFKWQIYFALLNGYFFAISSFCHIIKEIYFSCQLEGMATGSLWQLQGDQFTQKIFHCGTKSHISLKKNKVDYSSLSTTSNMDSQLYRQKTHQKLLLQGFPCIVILTG
jgi:hypothetical protein